MNNTGTLFAESLGRATNRSIKSIVKVLASVKKKGVFFCKAPIDEHLDTEKFPIRMLYKRVSPPEHDTVLSCGPFAVDAKYYREVMASDLDDEAKQILFSMHRIIFENTGVPGISKIGLHSSNENEDDFNEAIAFGTLWNIFNGEEINGVMWIEPSDKVRQAAEMITGKKFPAGSYEWWDVQIEFGRGWGVDKENYEKGLIKFHENVHKWIAYLPSHTGITLQTLMTTNIIVESNAIISRPRAKSFIENIAKSIREDSEEDEIFDADRELLIYELLSYNRIDYPIDVDDYYELFIQIGAIKETSKKGKVHVVANHNMSSPSDKLIIPTGWQQKMNKFIITGSILFSYCSLNEIIEG